MNWCKNNTSVAKENKKSVVIPIFLETVVYLLHPLLLTKKAYFISFFRGFNSNFHTRISIVNSNSMMFLNYIKKRLFFILAAISALIFLSSCGIWDPADARKVSPNSKERVKKNLEEGKGITLKGLTGGKAGTSYQFASSNPLWRATLEILDFLPLSNVDYSGGIITTDWYNEGTASDESIKITVRFLTNEIRADGIKIIVHKKKCTITEKCTVRKISSALESELQLAILKKAVIFEKEFNKGKKKNKRPEIK